MRTTWNAALLATALTVVPATSHATVDGMLDYTVIYEEIQTGDRCLMRLPMLASLGIPPASAMKAVFAPTKVFNDRISSATYSNINLVATSPAMTATYLRDDFSGRTLTYAMTVNVSALAAANGSSTAGRQRTVTAAKLALLAMAYTLDDLSRGSYRLTVQFVGLPAQNGLAGTKLYATTTYPYTSGSTLLSAYGAELINVGGTCPVR
jgi:hypothetical protein